MDEAAARLPLEGDPTGAWSVSAGARLVPRSWPGDAVCAVALSFDLDFETPLNVDGRATPCVLSEAQYGARRGIQRILELLARQTTPATFFVPAMAARRWSTLVAEIASLGHEVGLHGLAHERPSARTPDEERRALAQSIAILEDVCGRRPVGQRAPSFDISEHSIELADEFRLLYDSSLMADDEPYRLVVRGRDTSVVEVPVDWLRDDASYFVMARWESLRPVPDATSVLATWVAEYEGARRERGLFQLTMHPDLIGHRSRLGILERLVERIAADDRVWFATHAEVAEACLAGG